MFVYLLKHAEEPRFKIGKANDIYQRMPGIGGMQAFDLTGSLCIQLPSVDDAYRVEKILHRLFVKWNLPVDEEKRYPGDTEQFHADCFDRVLKFLADNADLTDGCLPMSLPPVPISVTMGYTDGEAVTLEERRLRRDKARAEKRKSFIEEIRGRHKEALEMLEMFVGYVERGDIQCGIWSSESEPGRLRLFTCALQDNEGLEFAKHELINTFIIPPQGGLCSVFGGCSYFGGFGIHEYFATTLDKWDFALRQWDSETHNPHDRLQGGQNSPLHHLDSERLSAAPSMREMTSKMMGLIERIPLIDDIGVFTLLRSSGLVGDVDKMGIRGLKDKLHRVMLHRYSGQNPFDGSEKGSESITNWIVSYCVWGLSTLGVEQTKIMRFIKTTQAAAISELKGMEREEDPLWGLWIYKQPLPSLFA